MRSTLNTLAGAAMAAAFLTMPAAPAAAQAPLAAGPGSPIETPATAPARTVAPPPPERLMDAEDLLGRPVLGAVEGRIGEVVDVVMTPRGAADTLVVKLDDRFAPGREVAIPLEPGRVRIGDDWIAVPDLTAEDIAALPTVVAEEGVVSLNRAARGDPTGPRPEEVHGASE